MNDTFGGSTRRFWRSIMVIARRDFGAILFSRSFIFFLLGPLLPVFVAVMAGGIGASVSGKIEAPKLGLALESSEADAFLAARKRLAESVSDLPDAVVIIRLKPGDRIMARSALARAKGGSPVTALLSGSLTNPKLTGPEAQVDRWRGGVALIAAEALRTDASQLPTVALDKTISARADTVRKRIRTAQASQMMLFLLTMLLAGMVMSNMVEEKANKIIEVLAAAVPMDAVFYGKLIAMLGVSLVGLSIWGLVMLPIGLSGGGLDRLAAPAVGWPMFIALGLLYFSFAYLLLGSLFLTIGGLAATVREVQTLSMPATMLQLIVFFFASYALGAMGEPIEWVAILFPLTSPYTMLARAAVEPDFWPHLAAIVWQAFCVALIIKGGSTLFRKTVMKSGPSMGKRTFLRKLLRRPA
ncbi:ABC transporter permease [Croceicoccus naphthovorans]|uniref:ABC transporter permease n=1 Tax=Croceicoccus naphthovorans TaxID=1348774 RepID=A0A0G3XCQ4_9SPHN|nr:ABC transporter permease [Croceicoccus naphthovorans]AKM08967.1 ABC transporter permease [Croceicoccus naphthovorans]MBB3989236.1 ABC-2 type transport system permease protein [Croceicoccus naphthovorans]